MGYCPFSSAGSRYRRLNLDTRPGRQGWDEQQVRRLGPNDTASLRVGRAPALGLATGVCRDTMVYIVTGGWPLCRDTARVRGYDTAPNALRYSAQRPVIRRRSAVTRAAARSACGRDLSRDTIFVS